MSSSKDPDCRHPHEPPHVIMNNIALNINNLNTLKNSAEQPQTKRQKIEKFKPTNGFSKTKSNAALPTLSLPADKIVTEVSKILSSSISSSVNFSTSPSSSDGTCILKPLSLKAASFTQLINVQNVNHILPLTNKYHYHHYTDNQNEDDVMFSSDTRSCTSSSSSDLADDVVDHCIVPDLLPLNSQSTNITKNTSTANYHSANTTTSFQLQQAFDEQTATRDMREFEDSLMKQCLCGVSERMLRKPFQSHYSLDVNGQARVANLSEWPTNKLLQFLSNLQLLFDIYLKQNLKGFTCARIMDVCDALIRNDQNLIDEIIVLADYSNAYVQFLAGRVLASFLVIAKQEIDDNWLKKLIDNLFNFDCLDQKTVQRIYFSLEIIKRIVDWKDIDLHPLEDEIEDSENITDGTPSMSNVANVNASFADETNLSFIHFQPQQPSLKSNYFAVHYRSTESLDGLSSSSSSSGHYKNNVLTNHNFNNLSSPACRQHHFASHHSTQHLSTVVQQQDCHLIILPDSKCVDTTDLKCKTIKILENKWPALVENMIALIRSHLDFENAENCLLNFLQLWENIISVKANLPIGETQPFYAQLNIELLLNRNLSCTVYKQMLCLFNEALCYGSTLALQDILPNDICKLAKQVVIYVQDSPILESLPREQPANEVGLIGFKGKPIDYNFDSLHSYQCDLINYDSELSFDIRDGIKMDKTVLQKFVLLVLKSMAVKIKIIRIDSSDSSMDSADYEAFQDMQLIESIIEAVHKLESYIKDALELLPQCHFSEILIRLFDDQDDHLIEAMVCTLDVAARVLFLNNTLPEVQSQRLNLLVTTLNPVYTFLEFLNSIRYKYDLLLDLLVSNETCFLLYMLHFLKFICKNWLMFVDSCHNFAVVAGLQQHQQSTLDDAMGVLISLRLQISRLVSRQLYPYDISPVTNLLLSCERFYEGESV